MLRYDKIGSSLVYKFDFYFSKEQINNFVYKVQPLKSLAKFLNNNSDFDDKKIFYIDQTSYSKSIFFRSQSIFLELAFLWNTN